MVRGKKLCDFVGKNEKTKIVCKLQKVRSRVCLVNVGKVIIIMKKLYLYQFQGDSSFMGVHSVGMI